MWTQEEQEEFSVGRRCRRKENEANYIFDSKKSCFVDKLLREAFKRRLEASVAPRRERESCERDEKS